MKKITVVEFNKLILEMAETWPEMKSESRIKRYYIAISDLELDIVRSICNDFLDSRTKIPLPNDFKEAANLFKKYYFEKTGQYYGNERSKAKSESVEVDCSYCFDTGFEWLSVDGICVFGFCFCEKGIAQDKYSQWILLRASQIPNVQRKPFPVDSFKPVDGQLKDLMKSDKIKGFYDALKEAHDFWQEYSIKESKKS